jgi:hypothetical protein
MITIKRLSKLFTEKIIIKSIKVDSSNVKNFGRNFTTTEIEKYLDPYGFLNKEEMEAIDKKLIINHKASQNNSSNIDNYNETLKTNHKINVSNMSKEYGMKPKGPEPTRYGDWERNGKCVDF